MCSISGVPTSAAALIQAQQISSGNKAASIGAKANPQPVVSTDADGDGDNDAGSGIDIEG